MATGSAMSMNPKPLAQIAKNGKKGFSTQPTDPSYAHLRGQKYIHNESQFTQAELLYSWPSVDNAKKSARGGWTVPSVKAKIAELKMEHRQQLAKAINYLLHEDRQMCLEEHQAFDHLRWSGDAVEMMKRIHFVERRLRMHQADDFVSRLRYHHFMILKPLYARLQKLLVAEETARAQRARQFPKSSQGWRQMDTRDAKLKVAKFLLMDKKQQDETISREPVWRDNMADVDRVVLEYKSNIVFAQEVKTFVKENQTTDPRKRAA